jgi:hypothetical protein
LQDRPPTTLVLYCNDRTAIREKFPTGGSDRDTAACVYRVGADGISHKLTVQVGQPVEACDFRKIAADSQRT